MRRIPTHWWGESAKQRRLFRVESITPLLPATGAFPATVVKLLQISRDLMCLLDSFVPYTFFKVLVCLHGENAFKT